MTFRLPKIKHLHKLDSEFYNDPIELTEKCDGSNLSVMVEEDQLVFRNKSTVLTEQMKMNNIWKDAVDYLNELHQETPLNEGIIYFGESMFKHTIDYGNVDPFIGYAVYDMNKGQFVDDWFRYFRKLGIKYPQPIYIEPNMKTVLQYAEKKTQIGSRDVKREGIVLKNYTKQKFGKFVNPEFTEENGRIFGKPKKLPKMTDTEKIVQNFCTPPRVKKQMFRIMEEGYTDTVGMHMMKYLPTMVYKDILEEEILTISEKHKEINFKEMRKLISKECSQLMAKIMNPCNEESI